MATSQQLRIQSVQSFGDINQMLLALCEQQQQDPRWIMLLNTKKALLKTLSAQKSPLTNKLLRVDNKHCQFALNALPETINAERCSTLVVCAEQVTPQELTQLQQKAQRSKINIVVMQTPAQLH